MAELFAIARIKRPGLVGSGSKLEFEHRSYRLLLLSKWAEQSGQTREVRTCTLHTVIRARYSGDKLERSNHK